MEEERINYPDPIIVQTRHTIDSQQTREIERMRIEITALETENKKLMIIAHRATKRAEEFHRLYMMYFKKYIEK